MSLNNGFYESVINKLIDDKLLEAYGKNDKYIDRKAIDNILSDEFNIACIETITFNNSSKYKEKNITKTKQILL